jgi:pyridoxine 4-dehydrogenase
MINTKELSASQAGSVSLGGEVSVHRLGFGAMRLTGEGIWGPPKNRAQAIAALRRAAELGVNFIDTADSYGPHVSEEAHCRSALSLSEGLRDRNERRLEPPGTQPKLSRVPQLAATR